MTEIFTLDEAIRLYSEDRIIESMIVYERLLQEETDGALLLKIRIWRELSIAKMYDSSPLGRLPELNDFAKKSGITELVSLSACFYFLVLYMLGKKTDTEDGIGHKLWEELNGSGIPEHQLQAKLACFYISDMPYVYCDLYELKKAVIPVPELIERYMTDHDKECNEEEKSFWQSLRDEQIYPALEKKKETREYLLDVVKDLDDEPYVNSYPCIGCEAKCCLDGVYLDEAEAGMLKDFVSKYREDFDGVPEEFIDRVPSMYEGFPDEIKTIAVPHEYKCDDFPKHLNKTTCVFTDEQGLCRLQTTALKHGLQPYHAKPMVCWSFPIEDIRMGKIAAPPKRHEDDEFYKGEEYPGYVSCLPCCRPVAEGISWKNYNMLNIEYYKIMKDRGMLPTEEEVEKLLEQYKK